MPAWLMFLLSGAVVIVAGMRLSRDADVIALRTGLGGVWVGAILVAAATSLPELTTDFYAVRQGDVSLAVGDLFGSSMANIFFLAVADLATWRVRVLTQVAISQTLVGLLAITLTAVAAAGALVDQGLTLFWWGWASVILIIAYASGLRVLFHNRQVSAVLGPEEPDVGRKPAARLDRAVLGFVVAAGVILVAARFLAGSAATLAGELGVATGFIGVALLAITTSMPEAVVSIASVRAGRYDLAVGNLLGSCCFNMALFFPLDVVDGGGSLLAKADASAVVAALFAVILLGQVLMEILNRSERRVWYIEPGPVFVILTYVAGLYLTYWLGH